MGETIVLIVAHHARTELLIRRRCSTGKRARLSHAAGVDVYDFAASVAQLIFSSPSSAEATGSSDGSDTPPAGAIQSEEAGRRHLLESLSSEDVAVLKQVAPDLFVA